LKKGLFFVVLIISFLLSGCGYKPSSKFARDVVGDKISTSITISAKDPENSVIIKDAIDSAIISVFHASLVSRAKADTHLAFSTSNPSYSPIEYDSNGFVVAYRMSITLNITSSKDGVSKSYSSKGTYDFSVSANSVVTEQERFDAIKFSAQKAIYAFISKISTEGIIKKDNN